LLLERQDFLKALPAGYAVDEKETFACSHVLFSHGTVFLLSCCVENIE
jgi:hypothetical protein